MHNAPCTVALLPFKRKTGSGATVLNVQVSRRISRRGLFAVSELNRFFRTNTIQSWQLKNCSTTRSAKKACVFFCFRKIYFMKVTFQKTFQLCRARFSSPLGNYVVPPKGSDYDARSCRYRHFTWRDRALIALALRFLRQLGKLAVSRPLLRPFRLSAFS